LSVKLLIFDLGNVFLNYSLENVFNFWSQKSNISPEELKSKCVVDEEYKQHEIGNITIEKYYDHICKKASMSLSLDDFIDGWNSMFIGLIPEATSIIEKIPSTIKKVILSNTNETHVKFIRRNYIDFLNNFDAVYFSNEMHFRKPDQAAFLHILKSYKINPSEVLFFDDMESNIHGAELSGIKSILVRDANDLIQAL